MPCNGPSALVLLSEDGHSPIVTPTDFREASVTYVELGRRCPRPRRKVGSALKSYTLDLNLYAGLRGRNTLPSDTDQEL